MKEQIEQLVSEWFAILKQIAMCVCALCLFANTGFVDPCAYAQSTFRIKGGGFGADAVPSWPLYIAQEKMFFAREGIQFDFARSYDQMRALIGGSFDIIVDGGSTTTLAAGRNADIVIVYDLSSRPSEFIALGRNVHTLAELEGKTIGIGRVGAANHLLLKQQLTKNGVDVNKISFRATGGSNERFAALYNGQISATLLSTAHAFRAQREGMQILSFSRDMIFPWAYIVVRKPWVEANSDVVVRFLRGLYRAISWLYEPASFHNAVKTLSRAARFEEKTMEWALKRALENKVYNLEKPDARILQLAVDWSVSEQILPKSFDPAAVIDTRYYDRAVK
jgi:ABC-type nitrate/sulfonate/bicarbonate transport system substrate-binding protein